MPITFMDVAAMRFHGAHLRLALAASAVVLLGCPPGILEPTVEPPTPSYEAVWINASWSGGRTGTPLTQRSESPAQWFGALCRPSLLVVENHPDSDLFGRTLTATNNCTIPIVVAWCVTAGGNWPGEPTCAKDARETPRSNLHVTMVSRGRHALSGLDSPVGLDINLFYCGDTATFNFDRVRGISPTDCIPQSR